MQAILEHRAGRDLHPERIVGIFPRRQPGGDPARPRSLNAQRFLSLDLNYGRRVDCEMYEYLMDNGMTRDEYHFFLHNRLKQHCIMGNDYYLTNEHRVFAGRRAPRRRARCSATTRSPGSTTTATGCR